MRPFAIGEFSVERVVDMDPLPLTWDLMFPGLAWDEIAQEVQHMSSYLFDQEKRQFLLSVHSYVVRTPRANILIDACIGNGKTTGFDDFDGRNSPYLQRLGDIGLGPGDIDVVMCTHMHADHIGWNTRLENGRWTPTFPKARYLFAEQEMEYLQSSAYTADQGDGFTAVYEESVLPVLESGQAELVSTDHEIEVGLWLEHAPGHTPGNVVIHAKSENDRALFTGDVVHHPVLIKNHHWQPTFCADPEHSARTRRVFIDRLADTNTLMVPAHFRGATVGHVLGDSEGFRFAFVDEE